jgi:glycosyltransferase involved in cell wall biosynthesis
MKIKVLYLIPGNANDEVSMVFAKRQTNDLLNTSFLGSLIPCLPLVMTVRGSDLNPSYRNGGLVRKKISLLLTHFSTLVAEKILLVSSAQLKLVFYPHKCKVIPSGVDLSSTTKQSVNFYRSELGWEQGKLYIFFNAGKEPLNKRLDLAVKYFDTLKNEFPQLEIQVVRGETSPEITKKMIAASDILFMTSEREGSPNVVKEALALGVPVVAHNVGDVEELLVLDANSKCLEVGDEEGFIAHARRVLTQRPRGMADMRNYSTDEITKKILTAYSEVLGRI